MTASQRIGPTEMLRLQERARAEEDLLTWTVYDHPRDLPHAWVVRPASTRNGVRHLAVHFESERLELLIEVLEGLGLIRLERAPTDDPVIFEVWV